MCGIAGIVKGLNDNIGHSEHVAMNNMLTKLERRGPDGTGILSVDSLLLGHTRLSILDLSENAKQPMIKGEWSLTFNGEIYNFIDLKTELLNADKTITFEGSGDTEVLLASIEYWGISKTLLKLEGMFAFAAYNSKTNKLYLCRDRAGEKPLVYGFQNGNYYFGSSLDAIFSIPNLIATIDKASLSEYLKYNYISAPRSIYKDFYKVPPGSFCEILVSDLSQNPRVVNYYRPSRVEVGNDINEQSNQVEEILSESVNSVMQSDVPLGCFLSGGIDSSLVAAMAMQNSTRKIDTFCIGFENKKYDESTHARRIANYLGTDHNEYILSDKEILEVISDVCYAYDEPFADSSQLPTLLLTKHARRNLTVALSGDGGDELFAGYTRYIYTQKIKRLLENKLFRSSYPILTRSLNILPSHVIDLIGNQLKISRTSQKIQKLSGLLHSDDVYDEVVSNQINSGFKRNKSDDFLKAIKLFDCNDEILSFCLEDFYNYLPDDIFVKVDRAAMYNSLETRTPFMNSRLIDYAFSLDSRDKIVKGQGKYHLRHVLSKYIPTSMFNRPKMGFGIPVDDWLKTILKEWVEDVIFCTDYTPILGNLYHEICEQWRDFLEDNGPSYSVMWNRIILIDWLNKRNIKL